MNLFVGTLKNILWFVHAWGTKYDPCCSIRIACVPLPQLESALIHHAACITPNPFRCLSNVKNCGCRARRYVPERSDQPRIRMIEVFLNVFQIDKDMKQLFYNYQAQIIHSIASVLTGVPFLTAAIPLIPVGSLLPYC